MWGHMSHNILKHPRFGKMVAGVTLHLILLGQDRFVFEAPDYTSQNTGGPISEYNRRCACVPVSACFFFFLSTLQKKRTHLNSRIIQTSLCFSSWGHASTFLFTQSSLNLKGIIVGFHKILPAAEHVNVAHQLGLIIFVLYWIPSHAIFWLVILCRIIYPPCRTRKVIKQMQSFFFKIKCKKEGFKCQENVLKGWEKRK